MSLPTSRLLAITFLCAAGLFASGRLARATLGSGELVLFHAPAVVTRKAPPLTANITGMWSGDEPLRYRINGGAWAGLTPQPPRMTRPWFTIELDPQLLSRAGENLLEVEAGTRRESVTFRYDDSPVQLPITIDWSRRTGRDLEAQDGVWETVQIDGEWRVRPVPGAEGYDRLLCLTPSFRGGRRIECDMWLRRATQPDLLMGVGVLSMWAGHPDDPGHRPRRGWSFAIGWYYSQYDAIGMEFSHKQGGEGWKWISTYRNEAMQPNVGYHIVMESWAERDAQGALLRYRSRMKWWRKDGAEPKVWQELTDRPGGELFEEEYCVALNAHRCQAEFGPVTISAVDDVVVR
ncbi:MAG: hypothetical protein U1F36_04335 [Planctomycetota bacterium]